MVQTCGCQAGILSLDKDEVTLTKTPVSTVGGNEPLTASTGKESVADILEQELDPTIHEWLTLVEKEPDLIRIPLNFEERTGHLPKLLHDVIARLRLDKGSKAPVSVTESCDASKATPLQWLWTNPESCRSAFSRRCTGMSVA
jgi:hypothetical protein